MDYQEKFEALNSLAECRLIMRKRNDWYVSQSVEIKDGLFLKTKYGNGKTPEGAILNHFSVLTVLEPDQYLVVRAGRENRAAVKWNGFMWASHREAITTPRE